MKPDPGVLKNLAICGLFAVCSLASVVVMSRLPYSTSWITRVDEQAVIEQPSPGFALGPIAWDMDAYREAKSLEPFHTAFDAECGSLEGLEAAQCITAILQARIPYGAPKTELFDKTFDPAENLSAHLAGGSGHCTTRSGLTATALLARGIPARVVQLLPRTLPGHNMIEVWDRKLGWTLWDPLYMASFVSDGVPISSSALTKAEPGKISYVTVPSAKGVAPGEPPPPMNPRRFAGATVHFPEPWLYTRVGSRCAVTPFRGCFAQIGVRQFQLGTAQTLARIAALGFALLAAYQAVRILLSLRRSERSGDVGSTDCEIA
jgi:hypothetical protein